MRLFGFKPEDGEAAGDAMPFYWQGEWHVFYLKSPKDAWGFPARAGNSMAHLVSKDLVEWRVCPDAFGPGASGEVDEDGIWTGSVIEHEGRFHFYYTGYNAHNSSPQTTCHAISDDLMTWSKDSKNPIIVPVSRWYETIDWRDPFVFWDSDKKHFAMLIAARENKGPIFRRGCIAVAYSSDLKSWEVGEPLWTPRLTHCMECPEVFKLKQYWYLVFSRYSENAQTVYRVSKSLKGPWESRTLDSLDGRRFYAAKSTSDSSRRVSFAWTMDRTHYHAEGSWEWGGHFGSPRELHVAPDGTLLTRLPKEILDSYSETTHFDFDAKWGKWDRDLKGEAKGTYGYGFIKCPRKEMLIEMELEFDSGTTSAGFLIEPATDMSKGYFIAVEPLRKRVILDKWPGAMEPTWEAATGTKKVQPEVDIPLVERTIPFWPQNGKIKILLLRKESMLECFVGDQVALTYRIYEQSEMIVGLFVQEGVVCFRNLKIRS
jgi:beta-fructofuranosidase